MNRADAKLGHASAGFALAAGVTVLFSTALAWTKDAYRPLLSLMNALTGSNWITQGLADAILFVGLGLIFSKAVWTRRIAPSSLIVFLVAAVIAAGVGLFLWYALY